jgi:hypothetical protein
LRIVCGPVHEHANALHPLGLLRTRGKRPRRCSGEKRDELAPLSELHTLPLIRGP